MKELIYFVLVAGTIIWAALGFIYLLVDELIWRRKHNKALARTEHFRTTERFRNEIS